MKALVVGGGSIGRRHLQNLKKVGVTDLALAEVNLNVRTAVAGEFAIPVFPQIAPGISWGPDVVVIASPTNLHLQHADLSIKAGCDVFIEKPLTDQQEGLPEFVRCVQSRSAITMVGCNMRFHPGPAKVRQILREGSIGRILFARLHTGSYLPGWRPGSDYRENYAARKNTGGGCLLDCVHEIDLARWYLGDITEVFCAAGHFSSLDIETEDVAALICRHKNGALSEIHLDYVQRTYERGCQIVGENGSIFWDFNTRQVRWYDASIAKWQTFEEPQHWHLNQMYLDEMQHFIDCASHGRDTMSAVPEAATLMEVVFAAKRSAEDRRVAPVSCEVFA